MRRLHSNCGPEKRLYGSGRVYRRGRVWWMQYSREGTVIRKSTGCTSRRSAERVLDAQLGNLGRWDGRRRMGTWRLNTEELQALRGPVVYILRSAGRVLYVGYSSQGLCRPLASKHHVLGQFDFDGREELIVHSCRSSQEAVLLEQRLIAQFHPSLN